VVTTAGLLARRRIRMPRTHIDEWLHFADGTSARIYRPVRTLAWRFLLGDPEWFKRFGGTVGISSVGMFGPAGGWGIPIAPPTLMITVGGIATKSALR
jgi:hypothetical protein